ncbi:hypothetical protein KVH15_37130 [Streptomyces olivaceus]|uniref:hypothetical protein n=1 Tax=Streptomyces olivaceus TaxID=47716 RepID=UPI001CCDD511|nr:hypothetical protein [Streptomyces olivaceus]MBZ6086596.1 hypothetical protein [Streptomyces olivaceus]
MSRRSLALPSTRSTEPDDADELEAGPEEEPAAARSAGVVASLTGADLSTPLTVAQLPAPYDVPETVTAPLNDQERGYLDVCEQALHGFRKSVIVAGKALEVINRGRLYRETHGTFVEYLDDVWEIRKSQAYRMIEAWPVAAAVSPIGDINEGQARELGPVLKDYGQEATVALYRRVKELRGDRRVTAADLAEARAVLPPPKQLARPDQVRDVLTMAAAEGRTPRLAPPEPKVPTQAVDEHEPGRIDEADEADEGGVSQDQVHEGAEAIATLEAAVAQQRQIYDRVGGGTLAAALLYDPGRGEYLRRELRQYANRTAYRMRDTSGDQATEDA